MEQYRYLWAIALPLMIFNVLATVRLLADFLLRHYSRMPSKDRFRDDPGKAKQAASPLPPATELIVCALALDLFRLVDLFPLRFIRDYGATELILPLLLVVLHLQFYVFIHLAEARRTFYVRRMRLRRPSDFVSLAVGMLALFTNAVTVSALIAVTLR